MSGADSGGIRVLANEAFLFPPFRLDPADKRLWHGEQPVPLRPKSFAVLHHLLAHAGRLVTKQELLDAVWHDVHVGDANIKTAIKEIRYALGDSTEAPRFIATVHRHGYRFIFPVESSARTTASNPPSADPWPPLPSSPPMPSLVAREAELSCLSASLAKTHTGQRHVVWIVGPPGIGKTALLDTFLASLAQRQDLWLARGQCLPHVGAGEPYLPMLEALGTLCLAPGGDIVRAMLTRYAPAWLAHLPALLIDTELDALQRRGFGMKPKHMLLQMVAAVEALSIERPMTLSLDDLQWCDHATLELIDTLARRQPKARLLIIGTYRSTELADANHPMMVLKREMRIRGLCEELVLDPLPEAAITAYCASRLGADDTLFPHALPRLVHEQSGGHPLFMTAIIDDLLRREEIMCRDGRWSLTTPDRKPALPVSVREFIAGEFERLDADRQRLLEAASVLGPEFSMTELTATLMNEVEAENLEAWVADLVHRQLFLHAVKTAERTDDAAGARFAFRHHIYREVVHARLLPGRRSTLHRRIGEWQEQALGENAREMAGTLAVHFEACGDWLRAAHHHRHAGKQAQHRYVPRTAAEHARRGIAIIQSAPASQDRIREELLLHQLLAVALITSDGFAAPELADIDARTDELCREIEDLGSAIVVLCGFWNFAINRGDGQRAREVADQLLSLSETHPEPVVLLQAHNIAAQTGLFAGRFESAWPHFKRCLALDDFEAHRHLLDTYGENPGVVIRLGAGWLRWVLGRPDLARDHVEDALSLSRTADHPFIIGQGLWGAAVVHQHCGDVDRVLDYTQELIRLCRRTGASLWLGSARMLRGWALVRQGRTRTGIASMRRGIGLWRATGTIWLMPYHLCLLADALSPTDAWEEASGLLEDARSIAERTGERWYDAERCRIAGEHARQRNDCQAAETCLQQALSISRQQGARSWELRAATSLADLWHEQGRISEARDILAPIHACFAQGSDTADVRRAQALLDR